MDAAICAKRSIRATEHGFFCGVSHYDVAGVHGKSTILIVLLRH